MQLFKVFHINAHHLIKKCFVGVKSYNADFYKFEFSSSFFGAAVGRTVGDFHYLRISFQAVI